MSNKNKSEAKTEGVIGVGSMRLLGASEAWERLCVQCTGETLKSPQWTGCFVGQKNYMYFGCGEGCCDDWWETKEKFVKFHDDTGFYVEAPNA